MINRNKKIIMIISTIFTIVLAISVSYAFFYFGQEGNTITLESGSISINFQEGTNYLTLHDTYPKSDQMGMIDPYYYDFTVSGSNTEESDILYEIQIVEDSFNTLDSQYVNVYLTDQEDNAVSEINNINDLVSSTYNSNRVIYSSYITQINQIDNYRIRVWVDESYAENTSKTFNFQVLLYAVNGEKPPTAVEEIIKNVVAYSVSSPTTFTGGLVAVNTSGTLYNETDTSQEIREYRYSGPSVNNYVYFNCADTAGGYNYGDANYPYNTTNCELWRIVGIFKNSSGEWNVKLMRNIVLQTSELVSTYTYNGTTYNIQYSTGNTVYWNKKASGTNNNDWTTAGLQYFLNAKNGSGYLATIKSSSKSLIDDDYKYHLGNVVYGSSGDTTITAYDNERKITVCASSVTSDSHSSNCYVWSGNQPDWNGAIGLLYPSDVGYAAHNSYWSATKLIADNDSVKASSWMMQNANHSSHEWLLSPSSSYSDDAFFWHSLGNLPKSFVYANICGARPVLNLKSETTSLAGRDGSINLPYVFIGR